jgi:hypothetical protein
MNKQKFVIVGAGGFGREVYVWLRDWISHTAQPGEYEISGFLDDSSTALERFGAMPPILSSIDDYQHQDGVLLVCAIAEPMIKNVVYV